MRFLAILITGCAACLGAPVAMLAVAAPVAGQLTLVVGPDPESLITTSGGRIAGPFTARFGAFGWSDDPDWADRVRETAWIVSDGRTLFYLCGGEL